MTINDWLQTSQAKLKSAGIESYSLDCLVLLEHVTRLSKAHILAHKDKELTTKQQNNLNKLLIRRINREPIAYITEIKEFYGRSFYVNNHALIPRPESESFIELLRKHKISSGKLIDVGCGSGILGITIKLEAPKLNVTVSDISEKALRVTKKNADKLNADVIIKKQSLLDEYYDVVLANLPYVPLDVKLEKELEYEPRIALFANDDGLNIYREFCDKIAKFKPQYVLTESLINQHETLNSLISTINYKCIDTNGLVQMFRNS